MAVALGLTTVLGGTPASAGILQDTILRSWATGVCADSNWAGQAYTLGCNGGAFQVWTPYGTGRSGCSPYGCGPFVVVKNQQTGRALDSNFHGAVYTTEYLMDDNKHQHWMMIGDDYVTQFQNVATGLCLHTNGHGELITTSCGSNFQDWKQGY